jgi:predicted negative regulator of RcsB-dependent stress response
MTRTGEAAKPLSELDGNSFLEVIRLKQREISIGVAAVAVLAFGLWLWRGSVVQKEDRAERALNLAANSYYSGNKALARTDLEKLVERYRGTSAGVQGAMLLAQVLYEDGQYDAGIKRLEAAQGSGGSRLFRPSLEGLIADGYADQKKYDEAARHFLAAADQSPFPADKDLYRADAARVLTASGKKDDARKIWAEIATRIDSPALGEAKIRLGELTAAPVLKN